MFSVDFLVATLVLFWFFFFLFLILRDREISAYNFTIILYFAFIMQILYLIRYLDFNIIIIIKKKCEIIKEKVYTIPLKAVFDTLVKNIPYMGDILMLLCTFVLKFYGKKNP